MGPYHRGVPYILACIRIVAQYGFLDAKICRGILPKMDGLVGTFSRGLATVIDGKAISNEILSEISGKTAELTTRYGKKPGLAVVLVGNRPDSARYVSMKKKSSEEGRNRVFRKCIIRRRR